jgi:hypothetical protein
VAADTCLVILRTTDELRARQIRRFGSRDALVGPVLGTRLWTTLLILPTPLVTGALVLAPVACLGGILAVALPPAPLTPVGRPA